MNEIKIKINQLVDRQIRHIPRRNTLKGAVENFKKKGQLIPRLEKDINNVISDYQKLHTLSETDKVKLRGIVKSAVQKFMAA